MSSRPDGAGQTRGTAAALLVNVQLRARFTLCGVVEAPRFAKLLM